MISREECLQKAQMAEDYLKKASFEVGYQEAIKGNDLESWRESVLYWEESRRFWMQQANGAMPS